MVSKSLESMRHYVGSIPMLGASMVQVHISDAVGSVPNKQALSVVPAEIIKMLALVQLFDKD